MQTQQKQSATPKKRPAAYKVVRIIGRRVLDARTIVYDVLSNNGQERYETRFVDGRFDGCTCPARVLCYHAEQLQEREDQLSAEEPRPMMTYLPPFHNANKPFSLLK